MSSGDSCMSGQCRITCELIPASAYDSCLPQVEGEGANAKLRQALKKSVTDTATSRYLVASIVYFAYSLGILCVDIYGWYGVLFNGSPVYTAADFYGSGGSWSTSYINQLYIGA